MLTNLNSMQTILQDLKEIVSKNQGTNHETTALVKKMEALVAELETKARGITKKSRNDVTMPAPPRLII